MWITTILLNHVSFQRTSIKVSHPKVLAHHLATHTGQMKKCPGDRLERMMTRLQGVVTKQ